MEVFLHFVDLKLFKMKQGGGKSSIRTTYGESFAEMLQSACTAGSNDGDTDSV